MRFAFWHFPGSVFYLMAFRAMLALSLRSRGDEVSSSIAASAIADTVSPKKAHQNNKLHPNFEFTPALARVGKSRVSRNGTSAGLAHYRC